MHEYNIQQVNIGLYNMKREESETVAAAVEGLVPYITILPDPEDILVANAEVTVQAGAVNLMIRQNLVNPMYRMAKRQFDIFFAMGVLFFLSPVYLLIALLIKLDAPGPVFFVQRPYGAGAGCRSVASNFGRWPWMPRSVCNACWMKIRKRGRNSKKIIN